MKKIFLLLAIVGVITQAEAQKLKSESVPVAVTTAFNAAHQTVKDVEWKLKDGNNYEAEFDQGKTDTYVTYDAKGNLVQTKIEIKEAALPAPIMSYVKQNYKEDEVKKAWKITDASGTITYSATVKDMHLLFDADGTFVKAAKK